MVLLVLKFHYPEIRNVLILKQKYLTIKKVSMSGKFLQMINYYNSARGAAASF